MSTMNRQRAMDIMGSLWEIIRDNVCILESCLEDFNKRQKPCCAIRKSAAKAVNAVQCSYYRFNKIAERYEYQDDYAIVNKTDALYKKSVDLSIFFGV